MKRPLSGNPAGKVQVVRRPQAARWHDVPEIIQTFKVMLACIFTLLAANASAAPYFRDGYELQNRLLRQDPAALAYVVGVYDTIQITQYHASGPDRFVCPPPAVTGTELVDAVKGYLEAEPAISIYPAALVVLRALVWAFPCDKT